MKFRYWTLGELWKTSLDKEYDIQWCLSSLMRPPFKGVGRRGGVNLIRLKDNGAPIDQTLRFL